MRVLIIHQAFISPNEAGGTRHWELARYLSQKGFEVTIVGSTASYLTGKPTTSETSLVSKHKVEGVSILRAYTYPSFHKSYLWRIVSFCSFMITSVVAATKAKNTEIVIGTSPPIFQALSAWFIARIRGIPFVLEIRDLWPEFAIDIGVLKNPFLIFIARSLERFLYSKATHIVVNSPAYKEYLGSKGICKKRLTVIPNGVDVKMFEKENNNITQTWKQKDTFTIAYAGALGKANDIDTILRAAYHLRLKPSIHIFLIGDGKERERLEKLAGKWQLTNVTFSGAYPKSQIPQILKSMDLCVATLKNIPMFTTTYPNKVFDYMAAGKPVVLAIDGVIRKVVENAKGGVFVPPGDDKELANKILELSKNPKLVAQMGENAQTYVSKNFDRREQAKAFDHLLTQIYKKSL